METIPLYFALAIWAIAGYSARASSDPDDPWGPNPGPDDGPRPPGPWPWWKLIGAIAGVLTGLAVTRLVPGFDEARFTNFALSAGLAYLGGSFGQQVSRSLAGAGAARRPTVGAQARPQ